MNLSPRSIPSKNSKSGASKFSRGRYQYKIFYVFDPLGVNLEIMVKVWGWYYAEAAVPSQAILISDIWYPISDVWVVEFRGAPPKLVAERGGLEPPSPFGRQISSLVPYQLGYLSESWPNLELINSYSQSPHSVYSSVPRTLLTEPGMRWFLLRWPPILFKAKKNPDALRHPDFKTCYHLTSFFLFRCFTFGGFLFCFFLLSHGFFLLVMSCHAVSTYFFGCFSTILNFYCTAVAPWVNRKSSFRSGMRVARWENHVLGARFCHFKHHFVHNSDNFSYF